VEEFPDGARIQGGQLTGGRIDSRGDHRIAMAFAMAGLAADSVIEIANTDNVDTSFPGFAELTCQAGLALEEISGG
jgi:3-phosphoshikimate 1-carboxyvinyltransferase